MQYVNRVCDACSATFAVAKKYITFRETHGTKKCGTYCSVTCRRVGSRKGNVVACSQCDTLLYRKPHHIKQSKSGRQFCNQSCAARFNNANKQSGYRRSQLEIFIEQQLKIEFPLLAFKTNDRTFGIEFDFYIPNMKIALEINGIVHYQPIYGLEKYAIIQANDIKKKTICGKENITLIIYKDVINGFTISKAKIAWSELKTILLPLIS